MLEDNAVYLPLCLTELPCLIRLIQSLENEHQGTGRPSGTGSKLADQENHGVIVFYLEI